jgi:hypothetical protein
MGISGWNKKIDNIDRAYRQVSCDGSIHSLPVRILMSELKTTRLMMLNWEDQKQGRFVRIKSLDLADKQVVCGWILPTKTAARVC